MKKKIFTVATIAALALSVISLTACSDKKADEPAETTAVAAEAQEGTETVTAEPESYGKITLGDYKGLEVTAPAINVEDSEIDDYIEQLLEQAGELNEVDRAAKDGDTVNIDYVGTKDGVAFDGGTAEGYDLTLGSGTFIDGFESGLIGAKKGETRTLHLTFPENYGSEELAGQAVEFEVTVNAVQERTVPKLTDTWVDEYTQGLQKTVEDFKADLRKQFEEARIQNAKLQAEQQLAQLAIDSAKFEVDPDALKYQQDSLWSMYEQYSQAYGMSLDDYFAMYGTTTEEAKADMEEYANELCKERLLVDAVFEAEKLTITDEVKNTMAETYGMTYDELVEAYGKEAVEITCRQQQVYDFLYDNAVIK